LQRAITFWTEQQSARSKSPASVPSIPGINHQDAVRALQKAGFRIVRQGKHIVMTDGIRLLTIPRHNPVNAFTMGGIVRDAGLTEEAFRDLL
jgi:predicted RNA binding protein YcfA (HicA-like mRNA interferase family)